MKMGKLAGNRMALPSLKTNFNLPKRVFPGLFKSHTSPAAASLRVDLCQSKENDSNNTCSDSASTGTLDSPPPERIEEYPYATIYKGTKAFWRTRCNLDIAIIDHPPCHCIEVIAYNAKTDREGPRIYLDSKILFSKMNETELIAKAELEKENCLRTRKSFIWESLLEDVKQQFVIQYILARINMTGPDPSNGDHFDVFLNQLYSDKLNEETGKLDTICGMPSDLIPYEFNGKKYVPFDELKRGLEDLSHERTYVGKQFAVVHKLVTEARAVMGIPSRGRDDSFAILSPSIKGQPRRRSQILRRSIDDSHVMENTSPLSPKPTKLSPLEDVSDALITARRTMALDDAATMAKNLSDFVDSNSIRPQSASLILVNGPETSNPKKLSRHRSHRHGLKLVNSWGSMNKINEALYDEQMNTQKRISTAPSLAHPEMITRVTSSSTEDDCTPFTPSNSIAENSSVSLSPKNKEDVLVSGSRSLLLKKQKSSKKMMVRSKSNKKIHSKIITREPSARTISSPSNDLSVEEQNEREKLKAEENTLKLQSGVSGLEYLLEHSMTSPRQKTVRFY